MCAHKTYIVVAAGVCVLGWAGAATADVELAFEKDGARGAVAGRSVAVRAGDTLTRIARYWDVSVDDVLRWNPDIEPDRIQVGRSLVLLDGRRRVRHLVQPGENLTRIAGHYHVSVAELVRWNTHVSRDRVPSGRRLVIYTPLPESRSQSVGTPHGGRLIHGVQLPPHHPRLLVTRPARAWGTAETVRAILHGLDAVAEGSPESCRIEVHDLSRRSGGALFGHRSHRSGRDADLAYFQRRPQAGACLIRRIGPADLDAERQWALFAEWIRSDQVSAIFMDYALQKPLYRAARAAGVTRKKLRRWLQYPRPVSQRRGLIRHHPRHADHVHVRFACHESDAECRP